MIRRLRDIERDAIVEATLFYLNYTRAAERLGISVRTVKRKMQAYGYTLASLREIKHQRVLQSSIRFRK